MKPSGHGMVRSLIESIAMSRTEVSDPRSTNAALSTPCCSTMHKSTFDDSCGSSHKLIILSNPAQLTNRQRGKAMMEALRMRGVKDLARRLTNCQSRRSVSKEPEDPRHERTVVNDANRRFLLQRVSDSVEVYWRLRVERQV
jgi:hypothetical protein